MLQRPFIIIMLIVVVLILVGPVLKGLLRRLSGRSPEDR